MRIVAGEFRGRRIDAPKGEGTRPTTDRVREALFSALASIAGPDLGGGAALDAFAGSGALGLEALSRGCERVTFVEQDRAAQRVISANIASLGVGARARVVPGDVLALARRGSLSGGPFALLLLDPPYRLVADEVTRLLAELAAKDLLADGALIVYEHSTGAGIEWPEGFSACTHKRYGTTEVDIATFERGTGSS
jgi:16S rRNA (guanine966-N2)-methyltransferase